MHERMLNKQQQPTFNEMIDYCDECGALWLVLHQHMQQQYSAATQIRFPYGKNYGWSVKYSVKNKHICDVFAENGAFAALFQVSDKAVAAVYDDLGDYAKAVWAEKSVCASGGWIEYRVLNEAQFIDLRKIIDAKVLLR